LPRTGMVFRDVSQRLEEERHAHVAHVREPRVRRPPGDYLRRFFGLLGVLNVRLNARELNQLVV
jgi:hypothetical protein